MCVYLNIPEGVGSDILECTLRGISISGIAVVESLSAVKLLVIPLYAFYENREGRVGIVLFFIWFGQVNTIKNLVIKINIL
jgi:hypothetical protein